jgi:hypothetical protein
MLEHPRTPPRQPALLGVVRPYLPVMVLLGLLLVLFCLPLRDRVRHECSVQRGPDVSQGIHEVSTRRSTD